MLKIIGWNSTVGAALLAISLFSVVKTIGQARIPQDSIPSDAPSAEPEPSPSPTPTLEKEFVKNVLKDQAAIWTSPLHLGRGDAKWIVPSSIGLMALFCTDRMTGDAIAKGDRNLTASRIFSFPGSPVGVGAIVITFYVLSRAKHDDRLRETGILAGEAGLDGLIVSGSLKGITLRGRPLTGADRSEFFTGGTSFPSGHAIGAWSVAAVVADEYHENREVRIIAYSIATLVGVARFTGKNHYISDVVVGDAIGYGIGQYVYHEHHREKPDHSNQNIQQKTLLWPNITPEYNRRERQYAVALSWHF